jgi:hypothetical protein
MSGWLFLLFLQRIMDIADPAEILSADGSGSEKNSHDPHCSAAVFRCFGEK